ncbi:hypothetical protein A2U01_0059717, partial [Trifolium medium]|nr:hypothetical protein [Trifolium medium]
FIDGEAEEDDEKDGLVLEGQHMKNESA